MSQLLEKDRQAQWRARAEQGGKRLQRSRWLIDALRDYLPPDHVALARRLAALQATIEGCRITGERVDGGANGAETAMLSRLDAAWAMTGYEAAARTRVGTDGVACLRAIAEGDGMGEGAQRAGYPVGSHRSFRKLVQLTLVRLAEYDDECRQGAACWGAKISA